MTTKFGYRVAGGGLVMFAAVTIAVLIGCSRWVDAPAARPELQRGLG